MTTLKGDTNQLEYLKNVVLNYMLSKAEFFLLFNPNLFSPDWEYIPLFFVPKQITVPIIQSTCTVR